VQHVIKPTAKGAKV